MSGCPCPSHIHPRISWKRRRPGGSSRIPAAGGSNILPSITRSLSAFLQGAFLVRCDMVGFVALDLVLRLFLRSVAIVAFVLEIALMNLGDRAADVAGFGIPGHVIAYLVTRHCLLLSPACLRTMRI